MFAVLFLPLLLLLAVYNFFSSIDYKASDVLTGCKVEKLKHAGKCVIMWVTLLSISCFWN
jgi:hypothetical protein